MLERIADKAPELGGLVNRPSKRTAARIEAEENEAQTSDDFYDEIDKRLTNS